jgi:hypothetical protein
VNPERLCVQRGGEVRWQVNNRCGAALSALGRPALAVVRLNPEKDPEKGARAAEWSDRCSSAALTRVEIGAPAANLLSCRVPRDAPLGAYKYSLEGEIRPLDPRIEVTPPH